MLHFVSKESKSSVTHAYIFCLFKRQYNATQNLRWTVCINFAQSILKKKYFQAILTVVKFFHVFIGWYGFHQMFLGQSELTLFHESILMYILYKYCLLKRITLEIVTTRKHCWLRLTIDFQGQQSPMLPSLCRQYSFCYPEC